MGLIDSWKQINLGKSATLKARIGWQGLTTAEYLSSGDYFLVTGTDFLNGFIDWNNCVHVEKERYDQDKYIQLQVNDILVTKDGTIGKVAIIDKIVKPTTLNSGVFVIRPVGKSFYPKYLYYMFRSGHFEDFLSKLTAGSTINHLYQKDFVHYSFPAPPTLDEQKAIADTLSDTDNLIQNLKTLITKKIDIKQGAKQELLTGKKRLIGFERGWETIKLGDISDFYKGKSLSKSELKIDGRNKCIHYGELFTYYSEIITKIKSRTNLSENIFNSKVNDVLMPTSDVTPNGLATASCINEENVILGGDILVIRVNDSILNGIFFSYLISISKDKIMKLVTGSTVYHLYGSDMSKFEFRMPKDIKEQKAIIRIISDMDSEIEALEIQLQKTENIKQGMMQELLTGRIRLANPVSQLTKKEN